MRLNLTIVDPEGTGRADLEVTSDGESLLIQQVHCDRGDTPVASVVVQDGELRVVSWRSDDEDYNHTETHGPADEI